MDKRERLHRAALYVVTGSRPDLPRFLDSILAAGVDMIQLRDKDTEAGDLLRHAQVFRDAAHRHDALFIVNDRPDVALAAAADGVHLGQNDLPVEFARRILGPDAIIGLSCHSPDQYDRAPMTADYVTAGPLFETPTKPGRRGVGLELVTYAADHVDRPWFAIGGIDAHNVGDVVRAGASRIAVVRAVTEADDPARAVERLLEGLIGP
jgi:thiamine-phosphate pyrophosphorylase